MSDYPAGPGQTPPGGYPQQPGYPPQQPPPGYPPQQPAYPQQPQTGYPPQQPAYPPQTQPGYPPQGPPGGYPPAGPPPGPPPGPGPSSKGNPLKIILPILVVLIVIVGGIGIFLVVRSDDASAGEVFLEASAQPGPNPFTTDIKVTDAPTTSTTAPPVVTSTTGSSGNAIASSLGSTPGLYGGTQNIATCDSKQLVTFLAANPDKASAWVGALNSDTTLRWSGGTTVQVSQISQYVSELTSVTLVSDTRVTNYGYANGRATARQAVLQRGTAVLVDKYGYPRAKCSCGNPLTVPAAVKVKPVYTGTPWVGWSPTTVIVVQQTTVIINTYVLTNLNGPGTFTRDSGGGDVLHDGPVMDTPTGAAPPGSTPSTASTSTSSTSTPGKPTSTTTTTPGANTNSSTTLTPLTGNFCADLQTFINNNRSNTSGDVQAQVQSVLAEFAHLTDESPPEIKDDMVYFQNLLKRIAAGDESAWNDPALEQHNAHVAQVVKQICGIDINA